MKFHDFVTDNSPEWSAFLFSACTSAQTYKSICGCKSSVLDICQTVCLNKLAYALDMLLNIHFVHFSPPLVRMKKFNVFWDLTYRWKNHFKCGLMACDCTVKDSVIIKKPINIRDLHERTF